MQKISVVPVCRCSHNALFLIDSVPVWRVLSHTELDKSAGMLICAVKYSQQALLFNSKKYKKQNRHYHFIYENFPLGTNIPGDTLIWYPRVTQLYAPWTKKNKYIYWNKYE